MSAISIVFALIEIFTVLLVQGGVGSESAGRREWGGDLMLMGFLLRSPS